MFKPKKEHEELRSSVRKLAETLIPPIAMRLDQNNGFPTDVVEALKESDLMGLPYPKEYDGAGKDVLSYAIAVEELSRVDGGIGVILSAHTSLGTYPIAAYGNEKQKEKYLRDLASGRKLGAFGLTEENAGSDAAGTETTAIKSEDGSCYTLNGKKIFITNAPVADTYVVFASTDPSKGTRGISAFIVEKGMPGFTCSEHYDKMGIRSSSTAELHFKDVKVPAENLLGLEGQGFKIAMATLDGGRIGIAAQALGIAQGAYEDALEYAREREQFGAPIGVNQGISFKLAEMATKIEAARLLVYKAAEMKENHEPYSVNAAMAKLFASDIALEVVNDALQIFGGSGYLKGMGVERRYRDAKITTIYEGTNEIQKVVIAANILGKLKQAAKKEAKAAVKNEGQKTGGRKQQMIDELTLQASVKKLAHIIQESKVNLNEKEGVDDPIASSKKILAIGQGTETSKNADNMRQFAKDLGFVLAGSRPAAEIHHFMDMDHYVGMSGQKFKGDLYIAAGISGSKPHLKGIEDAGMVIAINTDPNAPIFKHADYGIVGDMNEVIPMLVNELQSKDEAEQANESTKENDSAKDMSLYQCLLCGYVYDPAIGDPENGIAPGTPFQDLPEDWCCPMCGAAKADFEKV
ncbi:acyl-CoA dehydrogenase family protein [Ileibacterium valens]|uniref:acyl-CoA dehydrogenase family protein n=1 Tax=Ileibacterium valens TaxID=1862668 RepID=UPI003D2EEED9